MADPIYVSSSCEQRPIDRRLIFLCGIIAMIYDRNNVAIDKNGLKRNDRLS